MIAICAHHNKTCHADLKGAHNGAHASHKALRVCWGDDQALRWQVVKAIWAYIKEHNLQDPKNRRKICPDEKLGKILPARTDMLKMNQQLSKHVYTQGEKAGLLSVLK